MPWASDVVPKNTLVSSSKWTRPPTSGTVVSGWNSQKHFTVLGEKVTNPIACMLAIVATLKPKYCLDGPELRKYTIKTQGLSRRSTRNSTCTKIKLIFPLLVWYWIPLLSSLACYKDRWKQNSNINKSPTQASFSCKLSIILGCISCSLVWPFPLTLKQKHNPTVYAKHNIHLGLYKLH